MLSEIYKMIPLSHQLKGSWAVTYALTDAAIMTKLRWFTIRAALIRAPELNLTNEPFDKTRPEGRSGINLEKTRLLPRFYQRHHTPHKTSRLTIMSRFHSSTQCDLQKCRRSIERRTFLHASVLDATREVFFPKACRSASYMACPLPL